VEIWKETKDAYKSLAREPEKGLENIGVYEEPVLKGGIKK
jgi:hypothetical protein